MVYIEIAVILALTAMNGLLSMSEMALVSSRRSRLEHLAANGSAGARAALRLLDDQGSFLSTVQIGITLIGILAGAFGGATLAGRLGTVLDGLPLIAPNGQAIAFPLVVVLITYVSLVAGELVPKRVALADPELAASVMARPMLFLSRFTAPAVWLLKGSTETILALLGMNRQRASTVTEEEVKSLVAEGTQAGVFEPEERAMIEGVLRLADRPVRAIMTPRPDVVWIDVDEPPEAAQRVLEDAGYSRLLVCQGAVDHAVGVVHTKTLLPRALRGEPIRIADTMTEALIVPESAPVLALLERFRRGGVHMAVVVDEYGLTQGIVTPTDILEAISGTLAEQGEEKDSPLVRRADGSFLVDGQMPIDSFEDGTGLRGLAGEGDFHTVAGFMLHHLGHLPTVGEAFDDRGVRFEVVDMDGRRIDKVLVQIQPED